MPLAHRITDVNDAGGAITSTPQSVMTDQGQLVSVNGAVGTSHPPCPLVPIHCENNWTTANGAAWFTIEGIPVNRTGDGDSCGHSRASTGSIIDVIGP